MLEMLARMGQRGVHSLQTMGSSGVFYWVYFLEILIYHVFGLLCARSCILLVCCLV